MFFILTSKQATVTKGLGTMRKEIKFFLIRNYS